MNIAISQINTRTGDVRRNLDRALAQVSGARASGTDLLVFPDTALAGWQPADLGRESAFLHAQQDALHRLSQAAHGTTVLLVHSGPQHGSKPAPTVSLLADGRVLETTRDPATHVSIARVGSASVVVAFDDQGLAAALPDRVGSHDAFVYVHSAPYHRGSIERHTRRLSASAHDLGIPFVWVNAVGGYGTTVFAGGSCVLDGQGRLAARASWFSEDLLVADLADLPSGPVRSAAGETAQVYDALKLGLSDYVAKCGFTDVVLGLSGGIDSALVAAIAADALGPDHVVALGMPSSYSSRATREGAAESARNLGIRYHVISIEQLRSAFHDALGPVFAGAEPGTAEENIQARIRGTLVMAYANKFGALPLASGNRSEIAVGYCTLYGDTAGALAPIGDVPKTAVYQLAEHVNRDALIIPRRILDQPPSAELKPDQTDQDVLPPYDVLDGILSLYLDDRIDPADIPQRGFDPLVVTDVIARVKRADFKRRQTAPALRVWSAHDPWPTLPLAGRLSAYEGTN